MKLDALVVDRALDSARRPSAGAARGAPRAAERAAPAQRGSGESGRATDTRRDRSAGACGRARRSGADRGQQPQPEAREGDHHGEHPVLAAHRLLGVVVEHQRAVVGERQPADVPERPARRPGRTRWPRRRSRGSRSGSSPCRRCSSRRRAGRRSGSRSPGPATAAARSSARARRRSRSARACARTARVSSPRVVALADAAHAEDADPVDGDDQQDAEHQAERVGQLDATGVGAEAEVGEQALHARLVVAPDAAVARSRRRSSCRSPRRSARSCPAPIAQAGDAAQRPAQAERAVARGARSGERRESRLK